MLYLIILDFIWSALAMLVDFPKLAHIPFYLWPIILICPIYPILLACVLISTQRKRKPNQFLLAFASIPSAILGVLALIYYPAWMYFGGFNFNDLGQILWVAFYSVQGWYFLLKQEIKTVPVITVCLYFSIKLIIDYKYQTFGYLDIGVLSHQAQTVLFSVAAVLLLGVTAFKLRKS